MTRKQTCRVTYNSENEVYDSEDGGYNLGDVDNNSEEDVRREVQVGRGREDVKCYSEGSATWSITQKRCAEVDQDSTRLRFASDL